MSISCEAWIAQLNKLPVTIEPPTESTLGKITLQENPKIGDSRISTTVLRFLTFKLNGAQAHLRHIGDEELYIERFGTHLFTTEIHFDSDFLSWSESKTDGIRYAHWIEDGYVKDERLDVALPVDSKWVYPWKSVQGIVSSFTFCKR